ncbi:MAG TPA: FkbM family methyltransferase [Usitatibacter sp.]|nr:FkbM family methyltransferase [Usitatibacter sp.]
MHGVKRKVKTLLARWGYRVQGTRFVPRQLLDPALARPLELADVVSRLMVEQGPELAFVQVGAFDGVTKDPLYVFIGKHGWRGVMLEPQPGPAAQLRQLYRDNERITVMEAVIDAQRGERTLFMVESDTVPVWARGMASFSRDHIAKHDYLIPGIEAIIREIRVPAVTFDDVLTKLGGERIDVLQIDAEGADAYILSLLPLARVRPAIIHWEVKNLTMAQREASLELLARAGYRFAPSGDEDMLAVLG